MESMLPEKGAGATFHKINNVKRTGKGDGTEVSVMPEGDGTEVNVMPEGDGAEVNVMTEGDEAEVNVMPEEELAEMLGMLPEWRREKAMTYRRDLDRFLCAEAYLLLKKGLEEMYGITGDVTFVTAQNGKPSLEEYPDIHFNISHCPRCVCCAIGDCEIGVDVEELQYDPDVAKAVFNEEELARIAAADAPEQEFTKLWTAKEALLKMTGEGLGGDVRNIAPEGAELYTEIRADLGYALSCATKSTSDKSDNREKGNREETREECNREKGDREKDNRDRQGRSDNRERNDRE